MFVCVATHDPQNESQSPCPGWGILTPFPFDNVQANYRVRSIAACFRKAFAYLLGSADPCATAVHMEPFSTSAFKHLT
jgi:hypothetical protein